MPFTDEDLDELVRILAAHPERKTELRRLLLGQDALDLPAVVRDLATSVRAMVEVQRRSEERLAQIAQSQRRMDNWLHDWEDWSLQRKYAGMARIFLRDVLHRPRSIGFDDLDDKFYEALSSLENEDLPRLDAMVCGALASDPAGREVLVPVVMATVIDGWDVSQAARLAGMLQRAGHCAIPAVFGRVVTDGAKISAFDEGVAVLEGRRPGYWEEAVRRWVPSAPAPQ